MDGRIDGARDLAGNSFGDHSIANQGNINVQNTNHFYGPSPHSTPPTPPQPCVRLGLFPQRVNNVDRPGLREALWEMLLDDVDREPVALWGLPGSGKTQLALQYANRRFHPQNCSVFWIDARNEASFLASVNSIAEAAYISRLLDDDSVLLNSVRGWIQRQPNWVLVLDGADDVHLFAQDYKGQIQPHELIPHGYNGTVIWTSQDRRILEVGGSMRGLQVDRMTRLEAVTLLQNTANRGDKYRDTDLAQSLVRELQLNPLTISTVATLMREQSLMPEEMLSRLKDDCQRAEILTWPRISSDRPQDTPRSILDILIGPVLRLHFTEVPAYRIIATVAFMHHLSIPRKIAQAALGDMDDQSARKAVDVLKDLSFLRDSKSGDGPSYDMPVLLQEAIRLHLRGACLDKRLTALKVVCNEFPKTICYETTELCSSLVEHALKVTQWPSQDYDHEARMSVADLASRTGDYLYFCGSWKGMEIPYQVAFDTRLECLGANNPLTVAAMDSFAWAHLKLGNNRKAYDLFSAARKIRVNDLHLPETHPDVMTSDMYIGITHREDDHLKRARKRLTEVLDLRKKILGATHGDTVQSMIELADVYGRGSRSGEAVEMLREALRLQTQSLGEFDPRTMQTNSCLGICQAIHEDYSVGSEAGKILEGVLSRQQEKLGDWHPHALETQALLGYVYLKQNKLKKASRVLRKAATGYEEVLGQPHPKTKDALLMLADVYFAQHDLESAATIQRDILEDNRQRLTPLHRDTSLAQMDLAQTYFSMGRLSESKELGTAAYDDLCSKYGSNDGDSLKAAKQLAIITGIKSAKPKPGASRYV